MVLRHLQYATKLSTISHLRIHQSIHLFIPIHHIVVCFTLGSYPVCCARYAFCTMVSFNVTSHPSPFRVPLRADVRGCRVERQGHPVALGRPRPGLWQIPGWLSNFSGISLYFPSTSWTLKLDPKQGIWMWAEVCVRWVSEANVVPSGWLQARA